MSTPNPDLDTDDGGTVIAGRSEEDDGLTPTDEGGAIAQLGDEEGDSVEETSEFYSNLVGEVDGSDLDGIVLELWTKIDRDRDDRKERDKQYAEGIRRTGLGNDAPGGATFDGASRVVHPMITKATVEYSSRTIKELMPANGPVKVQILGKNTQSRLDKADRKKEYMNWQCMHQMPELKYEMEQGLVQEGIGGAFYLMLTWNHSKKRPVPMSIMMDDIILPSAAASFYTADRMTRMENITESEYDRRVKSEEYLDIDLIPPSMAPERTEAAKASDKIEGKTQDPYNQDGLRLIYHVKTEMDIEEDVGMAPYLLQIDYTSKEALSLIRNWEKDDETKEAMDWVIEFPFVPWRGAYPVGFVHLIGGIAAATTGALRALLDTAHINNLPTLLKLKGSNFTGQSIELTTTGIHELEGAIATDDIRKLVMPLPFNPPSVVLYQLLGFLVQEGSDVVRVTMEQLADQNVSQMPVGTTLALIEQGLKVLSAIHGRQHASFARFLKVLHRINRMYLTDKEILDDTGELLCYREDFQGPLDLVPVSDPEVFSDVQRYAQMQIVEQRATQLPQLYDLRKVELMILRRTKIPDAEDLLLPAPKTDEMNAVNENVALAMGRPVAAYPDQDHLAHIQVLLDFLSSEFLGRLPIIAPSFIPGALVHLKEHVVLWYVDYMQKSATAAAGRKITDLMQYKDSATRSELDKLLASISGDKQGGALIVAQKAFNTLPAVIQRAQQLLQSLQPPGGNVEQTPQVVSARIKADSEAKGLVAKQQLAQQQSSDKAQDRQSKLQDTQMVESAADQRAARDMAAQAAAITAEQQNKYQTTMDSERHEDLRTAATNETKERINEQDNETALEISQKEIKAGKHSKLSTGKGIGKDK